MRDNDSFSQAAQGLWILCKEQNHETLAALPLQPGWGSIKGQAASAHIRVLQLPHFVNPFTTYLIPTGTNDSA